MTSGCGSCESAALSACEHGWENRDSEGEKGLRAYELWLASCWRQLKASWAESRQADMQAHMLVRE